MRKLRILILTFFTINGFLFSQESNQHYKIQIVDSQSSEPLPFATILINKNPHKGMVTNLNGWAELDLCLQDTCIQISYVGYKTLVVYKSEITKLIKLKAIDVKIEEVVIYARENPAHRIIKKAVKNRKINNPDNISEYACKIYNKHIYDYLIQEDFVQDSNSQFILDFNSKHHVFLMESITDRFYKAPDKTLEKINKVRVSGFKDPSFAPFSSDLQPFHFYNPLIEILDVAYLSPISMGSHKKYFFLIEDTLYNKTDTTFIISFQPKKKTNFEGLKGFVHINTNKYAIENVVAYPAEKKLMAVHVQQKYQFKNNNWFPEELKFELRWEDIYAPGLGLSLKAESYIQNFRVNIPKDSVKYTEEVLLFDKLATKDVDQELIKYRNTELNIKELQTYTFIDSLGEKLNFDNYLDFIEKIVDAKIPIKKLYIPLESIFSYNDFEGSRLGLGLYTDDKLISWMEIGGWGAYGFRDKEWKYGGDLNLFFDRKHETALKVSYKYDAVFPGHQDFGRNTDYMEGYLMEQADYSTQEKISFKTRYRYVQFKLSFLNDKRTPQYTYSFLLDNKSVSGFEISELGIALRFAYKEKYMWQFKQKVAYETKLPVLTLEYKKGLKNFYGGEIEYDKIWAKIDYSYHFARMGKSSIRLEAGKIWGTVPYSFLFAGAGAWVSFMPVYYKNRFNTMSPNTFANNEVANLFFSHDFGTLLFSTKKWKPKIIITQAIGYGKLTNTGVHQGLVLKDMSKGYYENGLIINDIIRFNYMDVIYIGIGGGAFYNYGFYSSSNELDNFKFKITTSFSF